MNINEFLEEVTSRDAFNKLNNQEALLALREMTKGI